MKKKGNSLVVFSGGEIDDLSIRIDPELDRLRNAERKDRKKYLQQLQDYLHTNIPELSEIKLYEAIEKVSNTIFR